MDSPKQHRRGRLTSHHTQECTDTDLRRNLRPQTICLNSVYLSSATSTTERYEHRPHACTPERSQTRFKHNSYHDRALVSERIATGCPNAELNPDFVTLTCDFVPFRSILVELQLATLEEDSRPEVLENTSNDSSPPNSLNGDWSLAIFKVAWRIRSALRFVLSLTCGIPELCD